MTKPIQKNAPFNDPALNALLNAAKSNDRAAVETLLHSPISPFHQAAVLNHLMLEEDYPAADHLIEAGVDPNGTLGECTLLSLAAGNGNIKMVRYLLEKGADPLKKNGRSGWTPLHFAIDNGHRKIASLLQSKSQSKK